MILTAVFQIMSIGKVWNSHDLLNIDMPQTLEEKQLEKAAKQATKLLEKQGIIVRA